MIGIFARVLAAALPLLAASIAMTEPAKSEPDMAEPETVYFKSADGTELVGYLFKPQGPARMAPSSCCTAAPVLTPPM